MSTQIIDEKGLITLVIKRIENYTTNHQSGEDNIPHLCVKAKHANGYAWFGVHIIAAEQRQWTGPEYDFLAKRFMDAMSKACDLQELVSELPRLMDSIQDVVTGRKRPTIFGGTGNDLLQMHMDRNVQLDVYRDGPNDETLTYGGFEGDLYLNGSWHHCFIYHRGIILTNYIDIQQAEEMAAVALSRAFPEIFSEEVQIQLTREVIRTRNKHNRQAVAA
jgi:hypothetical protein